jgi:hypothetical protein
VALGAKLPRMMSLALAGIVCAFCLGRMQAQQKSSRPGYQLLRQNENWSAISESSPSEKSDLFDAMKYVPLNESGSVWASFGGHFRVRNETWNNFGFSDTEGRDDNFANTRLFMHADIHLGKHVRVFTEGKTALATDRNLPGGRRGIDIDSADLLNAFVDLSLPLAGDGKMTFRVGRQELLFGKQRLVSPLPWGNSFRTFEGFSGELKISNWKVTGFWTHPVKVKKYALNRRDTSTEFFGVYAGRKAPGVKAGWDLYWLGLDRQRAVFGGIAGHERCHTVGSRIGGKIAASDFDYDAEAAYQFGTFGGNLDGNLGNADISAYMTASELGYTFFDVPASPRIHGGFDYASGDDGRADRVGTFNQLFPLGHAYFGHIDTIARQNIVDLSTGVTVKPWRRWTIGVTGHNFRRANEHDAVYNAGGGVVRAGASGSPTGVGSEIDLAAKYKVDKHTAVGGGWGHFFTGDFLAASGPSDNVNFVYMWLQYTL